MSAEKSAMEHIASEVHKLIRNRFENQSSSHPQHYETYLVQFLTALLADEDEETFDNVLKELLFFSRGSRRIPDFDKH